ncbi:MAG: hypothetical protein EHM33_30435 [Chloroflexi bacterium]|nr:MAG: hypothetical protein EHM33_30435 [Chloroflexota bacterium]
MKKQTLYGMFGVVIVTLACSFAAGTPVTPTQVDEVGTVVAATMQALTATPGETVPTQAPTETSGISVSFEHVSLLIPDGLASGANPESVPAVGEDSGAPWDIAPAHLKFTLTDYPLQDKFHEPAIFIYPVDGFTRVNPGAAEQVKRLKRALSGSPLLNETLPIVPFFNAGPLIAANIKIIPFQNGSGVRELTEYAQYAAPINNHELFYHFQGLTSDEQYYVIAILPITAPFLAEDEKPEAPVPPDGVPIPTNIGPNQVYYISVTEKLNSLSPESYVPSLNILDTLIQSILVTNP